MTREGVTQHILTDAELTRLITEAIAWDSKVHYPHVRVSVDGGIVSLGGVVESIGEKAAAEEDASRIAGVTQVISNIVVRPEASVTDGEIDQAVRKALHQDARVDARHFEPVSKDKTVTLRGEATTLAEKRAAIDDTSLVYGVEGVVDQVAVLPEEPPNDHMLEELVASALGRTPGIDARRIHAHVEGGVVHLRGTVAFPSQKLEAERTAEVVPGVQGVTNEITVSARR